QLHRADAADLSADPRDRRVIRRLDHRDEVVATEHGVLQRDLRTQGLHLLAHRIEPGGLLLDALAARGGQFRKDDVAVHDVPRAAARYLLPAFSIFVNSSTAIAGSVVSCTVPRAPSSTDMRATVSLSGASRMLMKS